MLLRISGPRFVAGVDFGVSPPHAAPVLRRIVAGLTAEEVIARARRNGWAVEVIGGEERVSTRRNDMALSLNRYSGLGNLTRDGDLRYVSSGKAVLDLRVAINKRVQRDGKWEDGEAFFIDVVVWEGAAEALSPLAKKGAMVFFEGELKTDTWEDKQSGDKRSKIVCTAQTCQFCERPPSRDRGRDDRRDDRDDRRDDGRRGGRDEERSSRRPARAAADDDGPSL